ncbi:phospholipase D family protein [uncultured Kocuria sp.]|uniref:phospholipase D family protein n=1 Tax=uncultured Kocuria sp. TaxID=259305 RepID=UPI0026386D4B|nr:phospholipase D family protein [uncultured Kocuria sp.]
MSLGPEDRKLLTDALEPPPGMELDRAVTTTYSLDLVALLLVPLTFAAIDQRGSEEGPGDPDQGVDPVALLESVRRYADRLTVFVQAGGISVPAKYRPMLTYLEDSLVQVAVPETGGVFHPKVWVLRFRDAEEKCVHRVLVLSRNLTFDNSWDTILVLDESDDPRENLLPGGELADYLATTASWAVAPGLSNKRTAELTDLIDSLRGVSFSAPAGFKDATWVARTGERTVRSRSLWDDVTGGVHAQDRATRALVISPFLDSSLTDLVARCGEVRLLSRAESLDVFGDLGDRAETFVLNPSADLDGTEDEAGERSAGPTAAGRLAGLHAKIYLVERGHSTTLYSGSANATRGGFGRNAEFGVRLTGRKGLIDEIWTGAHGNLGLSAVCQPYDTKPPDEAAVARQRAERELERFHAALAGAGLRLDCTEDAEGTYMLDASLSGAVEEPEGVTTTVRLLSLPAQERTLSEELTWTRVDASRITPLLCVRSRTMAGGVVVERSAVLVADLHGAPEDRSARVLAELLKTPEDVLRYLAFLLGDVTLSQALRFGGTNGAAAFFGAGGTGHGADVVLFEPLMRAAVHGDADALGRIDRLVGELRTVEALHLLPDGLEELITVVREAVTSS